ncbi:unnamed protein product, partial [Ilex paraguariensis]
SRGLEREYGEGFGSEVELGKEPSIEVGKVSTHSIVEGGRVVAVMGSDGGSKSLAEGRVCGWTEYCFDEDDTTGFIGRELNKGIVGKLGTSCGVDGGEGGEALVKGNTISLKTTL